VLHPAVIAEKLEDVFYFLKIVDDTEEYVDYDQLSDSFSLKGVFVRTMRERLSKAVGPEEKKRLELALKAGLRALRDGEVTLE